MANVGVGGTAVIGRDGLVSPAVHAFLDFPIPVVQPFVLAEDMLLLEPYVRPSYRFDGSERPWAWEFGVALKYACVDILNAWIF